MRRQVSRLMVLLPFILLLLQKGMTPNQLNTVRTVLTLLKITDFQLQGMNFCTLANQTYWQSTLTLVSCMSITHTTQ